MDIDWPKKASEKAIKGRVGFVRIKLPDQDLAFSSVYYPPLANDASYRKTVALLTDWVDHKMSTLPRRATAIVGVDGNSKFAEASLYKGTESVNFLSAITTPAA